MKRPLYNTQDRWTIRHCPDCYASKVMIHKLEVAKSFRELSSVIVQNMDRYIVSHVSFLKVKDKYQHLLHSRFKNNPH